MLLGKVCTKVYDMPSVWYVLWSFSVSPTPVLLFQQRQNPKFRGELPHFLCSFKLLICDEHLKSLTRVSVLKFHLVFFTVSYWNFLQWVVGLFKHQYVVRITAMYFAHLLFSIPYLFFLNVHSKSRLLSSNIPSQTYYSKLTILYRKYPVMVPKRSLK